MAALKGVLDWLSAHPQTEVALYGLLSWLATGAYNWYTRKTPEEWAALEASSPRWAGFQRVVRAIGLDVPKLLRGATQLFDAQARAVGVAISDNDLVKKIVLAFGPKDKL